MEARVLQRIKSVSVRVQKILDDSESILNELKTRRVKELHSPTALEEMLAPSNEVSDIEDIEEGVYEDETHETHETDEADEADEADEVDEADETDEADEVDEADETDETDEADEVDETDEADTEDAGEITFCRCFCRRRKQLSTVYRQVSIRR